MNGIKILLIRPHCQTQTLKQYVFITTKSQNPPPNENASSNIAGIVRRQRNTTLAARPILNAYQTSGTARFSTLPSPASISLVQINDDVKDDEGRVTSPVNGVVCGLRAADVPVQVVRKPPDDHLDMVTLAWYGTVSGLERKVVVWLPHRVEYQDEA